MKIPYSSVSASAASSSSLALFRAKDKHSNQEMYFDTPQEAYEWMLAHRDWTLAKRDTIHWTFPLDKIIAKECWVKIEKLYTPSDASR